MYFQQIWEWQKWWNSWLSHLSISNVFSFVLFFVLKCPYGWYKKSPGKFASPLPPPPLLVLNEVWALGVCEYFQAFPVVLEKNCLTVSKCFHVCPHKSFAYCQLYRNKSKFLDYISESFKLKCGRSYHFLSTWY